MAHSRRKISGKVKSQILLKLAKPECVVQTISRQVWGFRLDDISIADRLEAGELKFRLEVSD
jgi:hypothetical protein